MERTCTSPLGFQWPVSQAAAGTFMDVLIHTWDLARAASQDEKLDPDLVDACTAMFLPEMPERGRAARHRRARRRSRRGRLGAGSTVGGDGAPSMTDPALEDAIRALAHPGRRAAAPGLGQGTASHRTGRSRGSIPVGRESAPKAVARHRSDHRPGRVHPPAVPCRSHPRCRGRLVLGRFLGCSPRPPPRVGRETTAPAAHPWSSRCSSW